MTDPRFPVLTQKQISVLKEIGTILTFEKETVLFQVGDSVYDFYVVLEGEIQMKDRSNDVLATHGINEFTGDNSMLPIEVFLLVAMHPKEPVYYRLSLRP